MLLTRADMESRYGAKELIDLTDRGRYESINDEVLDKALGDATALVQSFLGALGIRAEALPSPPPPALVIKACDIARWYLYEDKVTDVVQLRYDQALQWLRDLRKYPGMLGLNLAGDQSTALVIVAPNEVPKL